ncbi:Urb2 domain-containing protein [Favolaschia claudopus]|uniref:Urb2 domain-containing protein n=1 Tax=Favolaschia claudopus TaxID=2862362 RepID=A0AAW0EG03_9AGAR
MASQAVYHALKSPSDPPQVGGPSKIQIAVSAWEDKTLYMPNKNQVIVEWVLTKLLKDKANSSQCNCLLDLRFWALLSGILSESKGLKPWLLPQLNKVPLAPIITSFLNLLPGVKAQLRSSLLTEVFQSLVHIWPLAVHKISAESLSETFGALLEALQADSDPIEPLRQISGFITSALRLSVNNSSNKKKLSSVFIQTHLRAWIATSQHIVPDIRESVYVTGTELLFNSDTLRQTLNEDHPLFAALRDIPDGLLYPILPRIFLSFVQGTRKHRTTLFPQSSGHNPAALLEQVRFSCFSFFGSCQALLNANTQTALIWKTRVNLLIVVEEENLFGVSHVDSQIILQGIVPLVLFVLGSENEGKTSEDMQINHPLVPTGPNEEIASLTVECLSKLMQIDHDLILKDIPRVLTELLHIPASPSLLHFLELLLEYHIKARTMHTHIESLFAAMATHCQRLHSSDIQHQYQWMFSSSVLHPTHLGWLVNATRKFLTPSQTGQIAKFVSETLRTCWDQFSGTTDLESCNCLTLTFCSSAQLASAILTALPLHTILDLTLREVQDSIDEIKATFLPSVLAKVLKTIRKNPADMWMWQVMAAAILRLQYALNTPYSDKLWSKVESASREAHLLPELHLELFRMLLRWSTPDEPDGSQNSFERLLTYLEVNIDSKDTSWSGNPYSLSFGTRGGKESALAVLHMILDRWLPLFDVIASSSHIHRFVKILFTATVAPRVSENVDMQTLLLNALSSAQFWELPNLRTAILAFADSSTSTLAEALPELTPNMVATVLSTYQLLVMFPIDFLSRTLRTELVRRAINAELLCNSVPEMRRAVAMVRVFIYNVVLYVGSVDQPIPILSRYLSHLLHYGSSSQIRQNPEDVTLNLVRLFFTALLKSGETGSAEAILDILRSCLPSDNLNSAGQSSVLIRLVETLTEGFSPQSLSNDVRAEVSNLERRLTTALATYGDDIGSLFASQDIMNLWLHALSLRRWLELDGSRLPVVGPKLCAWASTGSTPLAENSDGNRTAAFAVLVQELHWTPSNHRLQQLDLIVAIYVSFSQLTDANAQIQLDQLLSRMCNTLSESEFRHVLNLTSECVSDVAHSADYMAQIVHLSALLLREHPPGTLKHSQSFMTACLNIFLDRAIFCSGPLPLRSEVLRLLRQQCADHPASLRSSDIGCIISLLSSFVGKSKVHDDKTSAAICHEITATIGALIRLRRDLVVTTLPSLGMVLQQLIATIRRPRPQLGAKQAALVADSLPLWVNSACAVSPNEGKDLSRLLETLTIKTTIRSHSASDTQRPESLARPFSKHAAYVLKAYIDAMNDPLCTLPADLRKDIRPGLFALCSMLNDHDRDAMMVSALDAGGKLIMKNLWTEYEKQKYVGKG